ncbi:MAG: hypothetical protein IPF63_09830 [Bacteroidetes bacterium]|nr:hypothetical protein [Bacteroidota bacterium]
MIFNSKSLKCCFKHSVTTSLFIEFSFSIIPFICSLICSCLAKPIVSFKDCDKIGKVVAFVSFSITEKNNSGRIVLFIEITASLTSSELIFNSLSITVKTSKDAVAVSPISETF